MEYQYIPRGVCSRLMKVELEGKKIRSVRIEGGCSGNLQGISRLVSGKDVDCVIEQLSGIRCGHKPTSCPDQLAQALREAKERQEAPGNGGRKAVTAAQGTEEPAV